MPNWIQNGSGGGYDLDAKRWIGRFDLFDDVIRSLASINRMKGSTPVFQPGRGWSVAIHSVACARTARALALGVNVEMALLRHDQHEAVIGDIPTPIAKALGYQKVEDLKEEVQNELDLKEGVLFEALPCQHRSIVKAIDVAALHVERYLFMAPGAIEWSYPVPIALYSQPMYDTVMAIIEKGEFHDGGAEAYEAEYEYLIGKLERKF